MMVSKRFLNALILPFVTFVGAAFLGCSGDAPPAEPTKTTPVRLVIPTHLANTLNPLLEKFSETATTPDGTRVVVLSFHSDGAQAANALRSGSAVTPTVWLATSSLVHSSFTSMSYMGESLERSIGECRSLGRSPLGAAFRQSDAFAVEQHDGASLFSQFITPVSDPDPTKTPLILAPLPASSTSGLGISLMIAATNLHVRPESLSSSLITTSIPTLQAGQSRIARFFVSDEEMLGWLSGQEGGLPAVALTSEQLVALHNQGLPEKKLLFSRATVPELSLDYPLCIITHPSVTSDGTAAQRTVYEFLSSPTVLTALQQSGIKEPTATPVQLPGADVVKSFFDVWSHIQKPIRSLFVIDTSADVPVEALDSLRRELERLSERPSLSRDSLGVITTSTRADALVKPTRDLSGFRTALRSMRPSGALALRDGLSVAMNVVSEIPATESRSAVVAIVFGPDGASTMSAANLEVRGSAAFSRQGTALYFIGVRPDDAAASGFLQPLQQLARNLGGTYIETSAPGLGQVLRVIFQEME